MKRWLLKRWWLSLVIVGVALLLPLSVSAVTAPDALSGLKEYFSFLIGLAEQGVEGYKEFLKAL